MRFHQDQKVVCVVKGAWFKWVKRLFFFNKKEFAPGPKFNEIVTVCGATSDGNWIALREYPYKGGCVYPEDCFEPLMDISELTEILQTEPQPL